jgi:tetraacyldisaccharide-1-P 4'-kinase
MAGFITFRDHHIYGDADLKKIKKRFMDTGSEAAVTTLKDAVKLKDIWPSEIPLCYIEIEIELDKRSEFFRLVDV